MNYPESLRYLNSFLNLERIQLQPTYGWNLERMRFLLKWAGRPDKNYFPILIAGTKGKGSTGYFLESILRAARIPVGFYSSPHLEDPRERVRLNGQMISCGAWALEISKIRALLAKHTLPAKLGDFTYFEIMTLLAAQAFKRAEIKVGIFEVGMGGRLDATNALDPKLVILTPINLDHEAILGPTIRHIAREKAAIIKRKAQAVVTPQAQEAMGPIMQRIRGQKAVYWPVHPKKGAGLTGDYQAVNAGAAAKTAELLRDSFGFPILKENIGKGLQAKAWPGRLEPVRKGGMEFLLDGAHNPVSIEALVRNLKKLHPSRERLLIFGTSRDKNSGPMLRSLSRYFSEVVLTKAPNPRSMELENLLLQARGLFSRIYPSGSVQEALNFAKKEKNRLVVVTGSFYVIGEARKLLRHA